jgi:hypothetical protein
MTIKGIGSAQNLVSSLGLYDTSTSESSANDDTLFDVLESEETSSANISQAASLMSTLATLQKSDQAEFKTAAGEIATNLRAAASQTSGTVDTYELKSLAGMFSNAATTGSLSSLSSTGSGTSSLRGYGSSGKSLLSTYLAASQNSDISSTIQSVVSSALRSAASGS